MRLLALLLLLALPWSVGCAAPPPTVEPAEFGATPNLHRCGEVYLAGQPSPGGFARAREAGVVHVINLRTQAEDLGCDEPAIVVALGMTYEHQPFRSPASMDATLLDAVRESLRNAEGPVMMHCKSANRAGAAWLPYRVLDQGVPLEQALEEAHTIGLRSAEHEQAALDYIGLRSTARR